MADYLFCNIAAGKIPSNKLYEDDTLLAFYDIDPQAPVHFLVIPQNAHRLGRCADRGGRPAAGPCLCGHRKAVR